jgi:hypothetical protein
MARLYAIGANSKGRGHFFTSSRQDLPWCFKYLKSIGYFDIINPFFMVFPDILMGKSKKYL